MLIQFSVANFRSINEKKTLTTQAKPISDSPIGNIATIQKLKILKTAGIYGANSSGKSNLLLAMGTMKNIVLNSVKLNVGEELPYDPFLLTNKNPKPTFYEIKFNINDTIYRYGFEHNLNKILGEWLFQSSTLSPRSKEKALFIRTNDGIGVNEKYFPEGINKEEGTDDNRLFISLCSQLKGEISQEIIRWFQTGINVISSLYDGNFKNFSKFMLHKQISGYQEAIRFFNQLQLGFKQLKTKEYEININSDAFPDDMPEVVRDEYRKRFQGKKGIEINSIHNVYNSKGEVVGEKSFTLSERESEGTQKLFELSGPIFDTLNEGGILVIDELDTSLHPLISLYIIKLFNSSKHNKKCAQLIFNTHDTHLLSTKLLRRDQIWFVEKDHKEQTDLYSMMDIRLPDGSKPRNDSNYEINYIQGRYGAIPFIIYE